MLTAILKNGIVQMETTFPPKPKENEELVRVEYCGICGTDYQKYLNFPNATDWGHEIIGRLADAYGNFSTHVVIKSSFPCGECKACLEHQQHNCVNWKRVPKNGYSEYITIDKKCILQINAQNDKLEYSLIEPLNVAINLVKRISPDNDDVFAIIGNGTIALLSVFYLWLMGYRKMSIYARNTYGIRQQFAESLGAETYDYNKTVKSDLLRSNKIINTAPYETMPVIINNASPYTTITFNGISKNSCIPLDMDTWHFKNLTISPSFPHPQNDFLEAIKIVESHGEKLASLITHVFPLVETPKAFQLMKNKEIDFIKVLIRGTQEQ
ncbi:MAG: alcohol dehydrogenase catalytic domain-containing protein [Nitrososphaerota archaeon]|jgi:L-iditol 2-dehydrogenase|nr:alcohol dehydrogenase catalytic domain-containing protein [Nitrososphaerota archaeon]